MWLGAVLLLSYVVYVFFAETLSPLPPKRFHPRKHGPAKRQRWLGYCCAASILVPGMASKLILPDSSILELAMVTTSASIVLIAMTALVFYFANRWERSNSTLPGRTPKEAAVPPDNETPRKTRPPELATNGKKVNENQVDINL